MDVVFLLLPLNEYLPIKGQCSPHIETSQLICTANQLTGFYMRATLALNWLTNRKNSAMYLTHFMPRLHSYIPEKSCFQ